MSIDKFTFIYQNKIWDVGTIKGIPGGSGEGSRPAHAKKYIEFLQSFIDDPKNEIKSIVDIGCGDWQIGKLINWSRFKYLGIDCVKELIDHHTIKYSIPNQIEFKFLDVLSQVEEIPSADLCIIKDVLHHWPNKEIDSFLSYLIDKKLFRLILITNCSHQTTDDREMLLGEYLGLSPAMTPLKKFNLKPLFAYKSKVVSCYEA